MILFPAVVQITQSIEVSSLDQERADTGSQLNTRSSAQAPLEPFIGRLIMLVGVCTLLRIEIGGQVTLGTFAQSITDLRS